jgi:hypothetical protein
MSIWLMADPHVISALQSKRNEIEGYIRALEKKIGDARHELMHVNATLVLFDQKPDAQYPAYMSIGRLFDRGELPRLCLQALADAPGPMTTRELAMVLMRAKGLDEADPALRKGLCHRITWSLGRLARRGRVGVAGKRRGVSVWRRQDATSGGG